MRRKAEIEAAFSPTAALDACDAFFLVGIGGAGMSALARILMHRGFTVAGTDSTPSPETERLTEEGIAVHIGHSAEPLRVFSSGSEAVGLLVTDAVDLDRSPEVAYAREHGIPVARRSQALGWALKEYKVIAVTGTHGKTTTTGLTGAGLIAAGLDPLVVVGANIPDWGGPIREGDGEWAVVEACEAYDAFHDLDPHIVVLTNLEADHLDYHGTYEALRDSVVRFVSRVPAEGGLVYCADDRGASEIAELTDVRALPYGTSQAWLQQVSNKFGLGIDASRVLTGTLPLALPGDHNRMNATAALATAALLNENGPVVDLSAVEGGVARFGGAERRLQTVQEGPVTVVDDYAHHPSEISASLSALRERYPERRLVVVYQPHLYSRTRDNLAAFAPALDLADLVVLTDIYPAREDPIPGVSSARIAAGLTKPHRYVPSRHLLPREVARVARAGDVIVGMGAGTISEFAPALVDELARGASGVRRVLVVIGGDSTEREVSLLSGRAVASALAGLGHRVETLDLTEALLKGRSLAHLTGIGRPDCAFLALHGTNGEDGAAQGLFELLHIPYTGSGILSSALAMDKAAAKGRLTAAGVRVPRGRAATSVEEAAGFAAEFPGACVVKPNAGGSTVGVTFCEGGAEIAGAVARALAYDGTALVEERVVGMEISVPVLSTPGLGGRALPAVEIAPAAGRTYDFAGKYEPGATEEVCPARLPGAILEAAGGLALRCHEALGCAGASRTDMIVRADGEIVVLEVNTLPGLTATSLLPRSAAAAGIPFESLCATLVEDAIARRAARP